MTSILGLAPAESLEAAVLETLAYFDVFDFAPRLEELHRYLHHVRTSPADLSRALEALLASRRIHSRNGLFVLAGRRSLLDRRDSTSPENARRLQVAFGYGRLLARLPFIRMVAVTGSVAMQNGGSGSDYDYLLATAAGRVWLGRAFAILLGRWSGLRGATLCPNVILSERALIWSRRDIYSAHELTQMIPVAGLDLYRRFRSFNDWTYAYLPNAADAPRPESATPHTSSAALQRLLEPLLRGGVGALFEDLEMSRKVARLQRQPGFGAETIFSPDICQGNFLGHGGRTRQAFERRLEELGLAGSVSAASAASTRASAAAPGLRDGDAEVDISGLPARPKVAIAND